MKKLSTLVILLACLLNITGCQKTLRGSDLYSFPGSAAEITGSFVSQGQEQTFVIGSAEGPAAAPADTPVAAWFYGLELRTCQPPEDVEGADCCSFYVDGAFAFSYQDRGSEAYVITDNHWYQVKNPVAPPLDTAIFTPAA